MSEEVWEVIVDTDFVNKITMAPRITDGKDLFKRTMEEMKAIPIVHYYVAERELKVANPIAAELLQEGYIKVKQKDDIVAAEDEEDYEGTFREWYNYLNPQRLEKNVDVFQLCRAGHSLGEIHSLLLAFYLEKEIIFSDDSDAKDLAEFAINSQRRKVIVMNLVEVYTQIGQKTAKSIKLSEVESVIRAENARDTIRHKQKKKERYIKVKNEWKTEE